MMMEIVREFVWDVLQIAWTSFAHTLTTDVAAVLTAPATLTVACLLLLSYAFLLVQPD